MVLMTVCYPDASASSQGLFSVLFSHVLLPNTKLISSTARGSFDNREPYELSGVFEQWSIIRLEASPLMFTLHCRQLLRFWITILRTGGLGGSLALGIKLIDERWGF